ncbi:MAG: hypothetical protein MK368_03275 [SAR324 cluster bacterium]|nr:hypothetical protein [SAR324 cluster bacterium]
MPDKKHGRKKGTNMVIEEQKDTLESTESSLEKQEENIQDVTAVESGLEEYEETTNDISGRD